MVVANSCRCSKCKKLLDYPDRIKITSYEFIPDKQVNGSLNRTLDSFNLCRACYKKYSEYMFNFF